MKRWFVNVGVHYEQGIADVYLVAYARDADDACVAIRHLHPDVQIYYATEDEPKGIDELDLEAIAAEAMNPNG